MTQSHLTKKINEGRHPADFKRQFPSHFCFFFSSHKWLCRGERDEWDAWLYRRPRRRESPHPPRIIAKYHEACSISDHPEIKRPYSFIKFFFFCNQLLPFVDKKFCEILGGWPVDKLINITTPLIRLVLFRNDLFSAFENVAFIFLFSSDCHSKQEKQQQQKTPWHNIGQLFGRSCQ